MLDERDQLAARVAELESDLDAVVEQWAETGRLWAEEHKRTVAKALDAEREACAELRDDILEEVEKEPFADPSYRRGRRIGIGIYQIAIKSRIGRS
jgi:ElaB/YqjD/DUF883 family membrane-anchored ribosome-binding protein